MAYTGSEIITFQFGHYSNFIGTHWWNCQEAGFEYIPDTPSEINHDVLFREGSTNRGEVTFTPRLLLVDLKGSLGALPERGKLYDTPPPPTPALPLWPPDRVSVQTEDSVPKNEFLQDLEKGEATATPLPEGLKESGRALPKLYNLDESVSSWSDFLRPHLHPRSVTLLTEYQQNDKSLPFETFPQGQTVWSRPRFSEDFTDRTRLYLEETDNLQGYQVLLDSFDGFSGLSCGVVQHLRDEYPRKPVWSLACQPPVPPSPSLKHDAVRTLNQALCLSTLAEQGCLFAPVSGTTQAWMNLGHPVQPPHLCYKAELYYHSSALVAAALDTVSLAYRLRGAERLGDLAGRHGAWGRQAVALSVGLPWPLRRGATLLDTLEQWSGPLTRPLTPGLDPGDQGLQTYVLRGVPADRLMRPEQADPASQNPAYTCRTQAELLRTYLQFDGQASRTTPTQVVTAASPLPTGAPFPHVFSPYVSCDGQLDTVLRPPHLGVEKVPVLAALHSSQSLGPLLESLHSEAKRVNVRSLHQFPESGLEATELSESLEQLLCLSECYSDQRDF